MGVTSFGCESLNETAYPVQESLATNTLFLFANIVGEIEMIIVTAEGIENYRILILTLIFIFPFAYTMFFFKTHYKRTIAAARQKSPTLPPS